jgi:hypothetical protein
MIKYGFSFAIVLGISMLSLSACVSNTEYLSYEDQKSKGSKVFNKDLEFCKRYAQDNEKQIEGSKGAGERFQYKNSIFLLCMKNKDWILRK